jgi:hypothetical protein
VNYVKHRLHTKEIQSIMQKLSKNTAGKLNYEKPLPKIPKLVKKKKKLARNWWLMPVILPTHEGEMVVRSQPMQILP